MKTFLESAALILGLVNGLFLLFLSLRNRPIIKVYPIYEETTRHFHAIHVDGEKQINLYGFLAHIRIVNKGNKDISFSTWNLKIKTQSGWETLYPIAIPNPTIKMGAVTRTFDLIGANGNNRLKSGGEITGFVCYFTLSEPEKLPDNISQGVLEISPVYGKKATTKLLFKPISHTGISKTIPDFEEVMRDFLSRVGDK